MELKPEDKEDYYSLDIINQEATVNHRIDLYFINFEFFYFRVTILHIIK